MSEITTPSLFDTPSPPLEVEAAAIAVPPAGDLDEKRDAALAKEFVRWCFSFGNDFRNSPDGQNLRSWAEKTRLKLTAAEEDAILSEARRQYLRRIDQFMKKTESPVLGGTAS